MRRTLLIVILLLVIVMPSKAEYNIDSALANIKDNNRDSARAGVYIEAAKYLLFESVPKTKQFLNKALEIGNKIQNNHILSKVYNSYGIIYHSPQTSPIALRYFLRAMDYAKQAGDSMQMGKVANNIGGVYFYLRDSVNGLKYNFIAYDITKKIKNYNGHISTTTNLAAIYSSNHNYPMAYKYLLEASNLIEKKKMYNRYASLYAEYIDVYDNYFHKPDSAYYFALAAINAYKANNDYSGLPEVYNKAAKLNEKLGGTVELSHQLADSAIFYSYKTNNLLHRYDAIKIMADLHSKIKDYKVACQYYELANRLKDSINNAEALNIAKSIEYLYNENQKDVEISNLKNEHERNTAFIVVASLLAFFVALFAFMNWKRLKHERRLVSMLKEKNNEIRDNNTELSETNKRLSQLNMSKNKFISVMAHDIKNPLTGLFGGLEIIKEEAFRHDKVNFDRITRNMSNSTMHVIRLLDNLLLWARNNSEHIEMQIEHLDLSQVILSAINYNKFLLLMKKITVNNHFNKNIIINADPVLIESVFRNILNNAIKYSHKESQIDINFNIIGSGVEVIITDYGIGMDKETLANLFKLEKTESRKGTDGESGTGLGLIIIKDIVQLHGGGINVESIPGKGTTFYVLIPLYVESADRKFKIN